jgi:hypothetical protein
MFDFYADYKFKQRTGTLSDEEAFFVSFISTFLGICLFFFYSMLTSDLTTKQVTKLSYNVKLMLGLMPFVFGLIGIVNNRFQKSLVKSQLNNYKKLGFSEKEALEQVLADKREYRGR